MDLRQHSEPTVDQTRTAPSTRTGPNQRIADRRLATLPARLTWKDQRGTTRFATVVTHDVSDFGVFVECQSAVSIPLYRLVQFQLERDARDGDRLPSALRNGRVLSAVYRVRPANASGRRQGLALRLMVDPKRHPAELADARATA
jgi:hypothetical protein